MNILITKIGLCRYYNVGNGECAGFGSKWCPFGSSYYRTPFPVRLWIWNAFSQSEGGIAKWITKAFGSKPKLMSNVNPQLRAQVAENQLDKYGYFNGKVTYDVVTDNNPKKLKLLIM